MNTISYITRGFSSETLKLKNTVAIWLTVLAPLSIVGMSFLVFYFRGDKIVKPGSDPWPVWANNNFYIVTQLLVPLFLSLLTAMVNSTEHNSNGWKQLYSLPLPKWLIYLNKYLILLILTLLSYFIFWAALLLAGELLSWVRPELGFQHTSLLNNITLTSFRIFIASLFILTFQFCISYRFKSFALSMGLGILFTITFLVANSWEHIGYFPFSWPVMAVQEQGRGLFTQTLFMSLVSSIAVLLLGLWDSKRRHIS